jgi:hypothetical protein
MIFGLMTKRFGVKTSFAVQEKAMNNIREWVFDCWHSVMEENMK